MQVFAGVAFQHLILVGQPCPLHATLVSLLQRALKIPTEMQELTQHHASLQIPVRLLAGVRLRYTHPVRALAVMPPMSRACIILFKRPTRSC